MDMRHLATLRAVRDHGGVTAAAAALHLTPSAVSQQLRVLSRDAGVDVVERVGRGIRLTGPGDALADAAGGPPDPGRWRRAAGWALVMASAMVTHGDDDPTLAGIGAHAVRELLA